MAGSGGTRTETTPTAAQIPPELQPLVNKAVAGTTGAMDNLDLNEFTKSFIQQIPNLTPEEQQWMAQIFGWAGDPNLTQGAEQGMDLTRSAAGTDPFEQIAGLNLQSGGQMSQGEQDAMARLKRGAGGYQGVTAQDIGVNTDTAQMKRAQELAQQLTGGDVGQSPATLQAMQAWEDLVRPTVMAGQALTGNLGGGSTEEALAHGKTEALTPLLSKEIDTRSAMAQMLGQLGLGASGQQLQASTADAQLNEQAQEANQRAQLQAMGLDLNSASQLAAIASGAKSRELASGAALGQLGGQRKGRELQAGGQLAAIGTEKANLKISALAKALETAGLPRDIATKQAQAEYNDMLRRQSLAEQMYLAPTGNFLAGALTPGSLVQSRQTGGGMFGS